MAGDPTALQAVFEKIDAMQEVLLSLRPAKGQLPSSFLIDRFGRLRVIYPGKVTKADCFRIGHIGHLFPEDTEALLRAIREVSIEMNLFPGGSA